MLLATETWHVTCSDQSLTCFAVSRVLEQIQLKDTGRW